MGKWIEEFRERWFLALIRAGFVVMGAASGSAVLAMAAWAVESQTWAMRFGAVCGLWLVVALLILFVAVTIDNLADPKL